MDVNHQLKPLFVVYVFMHIFSHLKEHLQVFQHLKALGLNVINSFLSVNL